MTFSARFAAALMAAAAVTAPAVAQGTTASLSSPKVAPNDRMFVLKAGASDKFEIESSKLVQDSANPAVAQFAQKMIADHTQSTDQLRQAALADRMVVKPAVLDKTQVGMIAKLRATPKGPGRDSLYLEQQKMSHQKALDLMQTYAQQGKNDGLKAVAAQVVPVVQGHIDMLNQMPAA